MWYGFEQVGGFQYDFLCDGVQFGEDGLPAINADSVDLLEGSAVANGFTVTTGITNVIGFSLSGASIQVSDGPLLFKLQSSGRDICS